MNNEIRAVYTDSTVRVYQAYDHIIADEALALGTFGKHFKMDRMTWIKPSFLWMMYRCGWGNKEKQERILAIDLKRDAFNYIINNAVLSTYDAAIYTNKEEWKSAILSSDIRVQWDPERDVWGNPLNYRSIQLGLRGDAVKSYVNEWIIGITDISDYVHQLYKMRNEGKNISDLLPREQTYIMK